MIRTPFENFHSPKITELEIHNYDGTRTLLFDLDGSNNVGLMELFDREGLASARIVSNYELNIQKIYHNLLSEMPYLAAKSS